MFSKFTTLLSQHIGTSFAKQLAFADLLGDRDWGVDISAGVATFGDDLTYPIQVIGTEADGDASWLWAWANEQSGLPPALLSACNEMRQFGVANEIPELTERSFALEKAGGHMISLIASGLNPKCCYYRGPYDGGAMFFLVCDPPDEIIAPVAAERALATISQVVSHYDLDHRLTVTEFLGQQGFAIENAPESVVASRSDSRLEISFDATGRLTKMDGKVS